MSKSNPIVVCVEPLPGNVWLLNRLNPRVLPPGSRLKVIPVAMAESASYGYLNKYFDSADPGTEVAHLVHSSGNKGVQVNISTVDQFMSESQFSQLDVLTIDAEGHDPAVLAGASKALRTVRYLTFEVHQDIENSPWEGTSLLSQVEYLDALEFDCYWAGANGRLQRITGCWNASVEAALKPIGWSNVACVKRGDVWHGILERFDQGIS
eukprot:gnl/MRDRNA2_/MRDRNA2_80231_c0_seq4.p1 gnl/MRDRNA2_/MRDRNA2_80231_c0~~gnl/MRDRNA2_/MRDRNA2_80231_c0_seq4.p1  ORF type:complete len:227 (-),score=12.27 gnl/MRDRNA2_/MRDRNA2_80231_c0_seq4:42-668(-)